METPGDAGEEDELDDGVRVRVAWWDGDDAMEEPRKDGLLGAASGSELFVAPQPASRNATASTDSPRGLTSGDATGDDEEPSVVARPGQVRVRVQCA